MGPGNRDTGVIRPHPSSYFEVAIVVYSPLPVCPCPQHILPRISEDNLGETKALRCKIFDFCLPPSPITPAPHQCCPVISNGVRNAVCLAHSDYSERIARKVIVQTKCSHRGQQDLCVYVCLCMYAYVCVGRGDSIGSGCICGKKRVFVLFFLPKSFSFLSSSFLPSFPPLLFFSS